MEDSLFIYTPSRLHINIVLLNCIKYIIKTNLEIIANIANLEIIVNLDIIANLEIITNLNIIANLELLMILN